MKQHEAVIKTMEENGGYATLGHLYKNVFEIKDCNWKTKTPYASIRRIVQDERFFYKIKPGLWALKAQRNQIKKLFDISTKDKNKDDRFTHSYYQGLLVEIGNIKNYHTYVPPQDKNKKFLNKKLSDVAGIREIYPFSYPSLIKNAKTIDVIWFNNRKMPELMFEVEHSTNISNSLIKFVELQDFNIKFFIIADKIRKNLFDEKISRSAFKDIKDRVKFRDYEFIADYHSKEYIFNKAYKGVKL